LANSILHLERDQDEGLSSMDEARLEKEIVSLLFALRALIEGAAPLAPAGWHGANALRGQAATSNRR
jgi:hypothetical protein